MIMLSRFQASPHRADPAANPISDTMYARVGPNLSDSQPLTGTTTPRASE